MRDWLRLVMSLVSAWIVTTETVGQASSQVRLISDHAAVTSGSTATVAIEFKIPTGWHVYWRNPAALGGVGFAPKVEWTLPPSVYADPIQWPIPQHLADPAGDAPAYTGTVWLLVALNFSPSLPEGELKLLGKVSWQECEHECVRGDTNLTLSIRVGPTAVPSFESGRFAIARSMLPAAGTEVKATAHWLPPVGTDTRPLVIDWETSAANGDFIPFENKQLPLDGKSEAARQIDGKLRLTHVVDANDRGWPSVANGLLIEESSPGVRRGFEVHLPITDSPGSKGGLPPAKFSLAELVPMLGLAFLGGVILNIMPCVLPVLALKILGFVRQAGSDPSRVRNLGLIYGLGVLTSFACLGGAALAVQAAGSLAGWSTALQNSQFRVILCVLLLLVALNLFGVFEVNLSGAAMDRIGQWVRWIFALPLKWIAGSKHDTVGGKPSEVGGLTEEGPAGAFFNGVLAAVLATPCTAPMLGTAIGFAFTQPPIVLLLIFLTVGLGLASPFILLCWRPEWPKWLPKPGGWMVRFKTAMGFPILGTCVWIFWFTATRMGSAGVLWMGLFLVVVSSSAWVWGEFEQRGGGSPRAVAVAALLLVGGYFGFLEGQLDWRHPVGTKAPKLAWQRWTPTAVEASRKSGHPVLVDFTADNCLNCQLNKRTSIEIDSTIEQLKKGGFEVFEADYTDADPQIAAELQRHGRRGVPLVLVYSKILERAPIELPTILTPQIVREALDQAAK